MISHTAGFNAILEIYLTLSDLDLWSHYHRLISISQLVFIIHASWHGIWYQTCPVWQMFSNHQFYSMAAILEIDLTLYNLDLRFDYFRFVFFNIQSCFISHTIAFDTKHAMFDLCFLIDPDSTEWRPYWKSIWPCMTLAFGPIISDFYFASSLHLLRFIPLHLIPNMPGFIGIFKMTHIFTHFLAAILDLVT